jgi:hypothetical protein
MRHIAPTLAPLFVSLLLVAGSVSVLPATVSAARVPSSPPLTTLLLAVRQTLAQPAAFRVRVTGGSLLGSAGPALAGGGSFDFSAQHGEVTLAASGPRRTAGAIFTPGVLYVRAPWPSGYLPRGRTWLAIDVADAATLARNFPPIAGQVDAVDPDLALRELAWGAVATAGSSVSVLGGRRVQRLNVMVDVARALERVSGPSRAAYAAALGTQLAALDGEGRSTAPQVAFHVFLSPQRQLLGLEVAPPLPGAGGVSMTFGNAGITVRAPAPPAGKVADLSALTPSGASRDPSGPGPDGG